jgi:AcrR family transcriptional regulator
MLGVFTQPRPEAAIRFSQKNAFHRIVNEHTEAPLASVARLQYDDHHMRNGTSRSKEITHERIVDAAARAIRRSGYNGTGVADIMKAAGLTHGGFYAHFASREAMLAEAADRAGGEAVKLMERVAANVPPQQVLTAMMKVYLSDDHVKGIETGCATAALVSEMPRQAPEVRRASTRRIKEMIDLVARQMPDWGQPSAHDHALVNISLMVGALVLARAVDDPRLSDALRKSALNHLMSTD